MESLEGNGETSRHLETELIGDDGVNLQGNMSNLDLSQDRDKMLTSLQGSESNTWDGREDLASAVQTDAFKKQVSGNIDKNH